MSAIRGSGEHRSIQPLVTPTICDIVSSGVKWLSAGVKGGIKMGRILSVVINVPLAAGVKGAFGLEPNRVRMREWKASVVIGAVSMSY